MRIRYCCSDDAIIALTCRGEPIRRLTQDTVGDKALRVVDGAIYVAKSAPLGTAVKVTGKKGRLYVRTRSRPILSPLRHHQSFKNNIGRAVIFTLAIYRLIV